MSNSDYIKHPRLGAEVRIRGRVGVYRIIDIQPQSPLYKVEQVRDCDAPTGEYYVRNVDVLPLSETQADCLDTIDRSLYNRRK